MNWIKIECPYCHVRIPLDSVNCPECRADLPPEFGETERKKVVLLILAFVSVVVFGVGAYLFYSIVQSVF